MSSDNSQQIDRLIDLTEFEIDRIKAQSSAPGWTLWAILGAIASLLWLLSIEIENGNPSLNIVTFLMIGISLTLDWLELVGGLMVIRQLVQPTRPRFIFSNFLFGSTRTALLQLSRYLIIFIATFWIPGNVPIWIIIAIRLVYGFFAGGTTLAIIMAVANKIPFEYSTAMRGKATLIAGLGFIVLVASIIVFSVLSLSILSPSMNEWRSAGLAAVALYLAMFLTRGESQNYFMWSLLGLRRALGLEVIDISAAKRQYEIIIQGMTASDVVQEEVGQFAMLLGQIRGFVETATSSIQAASEIVETPVISDKDYLILDALLDKLEVNLVDWKKGLENLDKTLKVIEQRIFVMNLTTSRPLGDDLRELKQNMLSELSEYRRLEEEMMNRFDLLRKLVKQRRQG
jgi:hypothetical protein